MMKFTNRLIGLLLIGLLTACGSSARRTDTAPAPFTPQPSAVIAAPATPAPPTAAPTRMIARTTPEIVKSSIPLVATASQPPTGPVPFIWQITENAERRFAPVGITLDGQGLLYVVDATNNHIQKFDHNGKFLMQWGSQGADEGQLALVDPSVTTITCICDLAGAIFGGIAVDAQGNVYVTDTLNHRIQKFDSSGKFLAKWGSEGKGDGQFMRPIGVVVDQAGDIYVSDDRRNDIQKFDRSGKFLLKWGGKGEGDGQFRGVGFLAVDAQRHIYVSDTYNNRIQKFDRNGKFLAAWVAVGSAEGKFSQPVGIAVDKQGSVYVADTGHARVAKFDSNGQFLIAWGKDGREEGEFKMLNSGLAIDSEGNVYVADTGNARIQKFRQP